MKKIYVFWIVCAVFIFVVGCSKSSQCNSAGGIWNENEKTCTKKSDCVPIPAALKNAEWNGETSYIQNYSMGKWSAPFETQYGREQGTCRFKCGEGYSWTGSSCVPECDKNTASFPCRDSSTGYIWSEKASGKNWKTAKSHCKDLNAENYGGFTGGWQMPNIDKLRTLLISEKMKAQCKVSEVNDCLLKIAGVVKLVLKMVIYS